MTDGRRGPPATANHLAVAPEPRATDEGYRALFDELPDPAFIVDHETGTFVRVNLALAKVYGYDSPADLIGRNILGFSAEPDKTARSLAEGVARSVHVRLHKRKDGAVFPVEISVNFVESAGRKVALGVIRDVSDRQRAEAALRSSEEKFSKTFTHSPIAMTLSRMTDGTYLDVNERFVEMLGFSREEAIGRTSIELGIWVNEEDRNRLATELRAGVTVRARECQFRTKAREVVTCLFSAHATHVGNDLCILGSISDITARKRAEEDRAKLQAQLREAQKLESVGRLAGGVAHDFNNMLSVILGHAELALTQVERERPLYDDIAEIRQAALRSADLTRQLLAFARRQTIAPKVLDLNESLSAMLKMLERLLGEAIALLWLPATGLWRVKADPSQLDQILANLCVNARDAGAANLTIQTRNQTVDMAFCLEHAEARVGDYVVLSVADNGCGVDKETLGRIFEPFFTTKPLGEGTGLGLATVYGIVKQNDGFLTVASQPGHGTTFTLYLPRYRGEAEANLPAPPAVPPRGRETILLVEDEPSILSVTKRVLERIGYQVLSAGTPTEALRIAADYRGEIHLLLTDVVMPAMNGRELVERLSQLRPDLRLVFMSGYTADVIAHHGVLDEGIRFLQKPFTEEGLAAKVREVLDGTPRS